MGKLSFCANIQASHNSPGIFFSEKQSNLFAEEMTEIFSGFNSNNLILAIKLD